MNSEVSEPAASIGIIGGTGPQGSGLAARWAQAGVSVLLGSRDSERAKGAARALGPNVLGVSNQDACDADLVVLTVPWEGHRETLTDLAPHLVGRILIDSVNPLGFDSQGPFSLRVAEGSAAEQAQALLPDTSVVAAFHHVSAVELGNVKSSELLNLDVLVLGDNRDAPERPLRRLT